MEKFEVDENTCLRCGMCTGIAPEIFKFADNDNKVVAINENLNEENLNDANMAKDSCPVSAIKSSNED